MRWMMLYRSTFQSETQIWKSESAASQTCFIWGSCCFPSPQEVNNMTSIIKYVEILVNKGLKRDSKLYANFQMSFWSWCDVGLLNLTFKLQLLACSTSKTALQNQLNPKKWDQSLIVPNAHKNSHSQKMALRKFTAKHCRRLISTTKECQSIVNNENPNYQTA